MSIAADLNLINTQHFEVICRSEIEAQARQGNITISFKPTGFWTTTIDLRIGRDWFSADSNWSVSINQSSGGRDHKMIPSDLVAYEDQAKALLRAVELGHQLKAMEARLEALWKAEREAARAASEAKRAAEQARIEADPELGEVNARWKIDTAFGIWKISGNAEVKFYDRGADRAESKPRCINVRGSKAASYFLDGHKVTKAEAIHTLARSSAYSVKQD